jgi:mono/diheme cytochrome c family protein
MRVRARVAFLLTLGISTVAVVVNAQQPAAPSATPAQLETGKKLFVQRCSVCHLPPLGPGEPKAYARSLTGLVKNAEAEAAVRPIIQNGIPMRMPGFKYGLEPSEIDAIVAYLRTLK